MTAGAQPEQLVNGQGPACLDSASAEKPNNKPVAPIVCVVPGCTVDVSGGPHYLKRHKICQAHLKAREVVIEGRAVRFCQQCGRFQPLADFKDNQRSCEAALAAHNARRRVKKDIHGNTWSSERRGRGSKRALAAASAADDPSSSEDGAVGASRKSAAPRKSSSQRSAPSNLQQSAAGSDSFKGSEGNDRPLSDGARAEHNAWTSHASPDNSYGSPEGMEQQQSQGMQLPCLQHMGSFCAGGSNSGSPAGADFEDAHQLHMLQQQMPPDGSFPQPGVLSNLGASGGMLVGRSRLGLQSYTSGSTDLGLPASCGACAGLLQQLPQDVSMGAMQAPSLAQQMMSGPSLSCNPGFGGNFGQAGTLEAWMMPQSVMQQQQAQLQQYWSPSGTPLGLEEAMGQSVMLQQAMQEQQQQLMMMSQPQLPQQPGMQMQTQMHPNQVMPSHLQQPDLLKFKHEQQQQQVSMALGSVKGSKVSGTESSGTNVAAQDLSGNTGSAEPSATTGPQPRAPADVKSAELLPATSAAAAAALAKDPLFGLLPLHGANSSSSLSLIDGLEASAAPSAPAAADVAGSGTKQIDEDALLDQALEVLLASGPDWQMDDVLLGPQAAALRSGTNSALVPPATTSSPSSSNMNGGNNLSGPLSVPSLPSATTSGGQSAGMPLSAQQAACGMAAAAAGLVNATDALRVGSPGKGPNTMLAPAQVQGGMLAAGGGGLGMSAALDELLLPAGFHAGTGAAWHPATAAGVVAGMDLSMSVSVGGAGMAPMAAGGGMGVGGMFPPAGSSMQMGGMGRTGGMLQGMFGGGAGGLPGGMAGFGTGMQPSAGGALPCGMSAAPALNGMSIGAGGVAVGVSATGPVTHVTNGMVMQHSGTWGFSQLDHSFAGPAGPSLQAMWQQQQQQQEGLLLQQQLMMQQQQQQAEYLLLQQQQQMQRRQHLMQLQQQINSTMTYSQQLVRLSIKLHGVTPNQLPSSTVLAMERLLVNNAADTEMILLQPSLRQGCIQFELDILVKCPQLHRPSNTSATAPPLRTASTGCAAAAAARAADTAESDDFDLGRRSKTQLHMGSRMPATVAALNSDPATELAQARLRAALPFEQLLEALLELPLVGEADSAADSDASSAASDYPDSSDDDSSDDDSSDSSSDAGSSGSGSSSTVRSCVQAIYAQVGNSLGIWRADSGLVQDWDTELFPALSFGAGPVGSNWRPAITSCMPLVGAVAESSSAASSPTAAAAGEAHVLKPLPLRLELQAAAAAGCTAGDSLQLWCTRRGQFLPVATRTAPGGGSARVVDVQAVAGLLDSMPGLLLLQADQQVQLQGAGQASTAADELGCMNSVVPVLLCPSAAMAAECNVHLSMMDDSAHVVLRMQELGLVLDFWAMHQQVQQQQLTDSAHSQWQKALLNNRQYRQIIKSLGTRLLLTAVISGMSATSAHLHAIMSVLRELMESTPDPEPAAPAAAAAHVAAAAPAAAAVSEAPALDAQECATAEAEAHTDAQNPNSDRVQEVGFSAAAAAGLTPVQEWVFEDVDCKGPRMSDCQVPVGSSSSPDSGDDVNALTKPAGKSGPGTSGSVAGAAAESDGQQSPYMIFRGATQMLAMLMVMYLLLEVVAAVYKGRSPAQQLLTSLVQLKDLLGIMLVPLAMMCLGGVLAVWQFGLSGSAQQHGQQQRHQQRANSLTGDTAGSKAASKAAGLTAAAGVA